MGSAQTRAMIHLQDLIEATGGQTFGPVFNDAFPDFCYDSRIVEAGQLFLAVKTEKGDGHDYIEDACRGGAKGVLSQRGVDVSGYEATSVVVPNTQQALSDWAGFVLRKYGTEVIGVTGSVGKTGAKEAIAHVLAADRPVFRNHANYNGRYGLPIALGRLEPGHRIAVLEMACDSFHEIEEMARLTRPRVGVVMSVAPAHLEYLGSLENIAQEKGRLVEALPRDGYAVLNGDDPRVRGMASRTDAQVITFGTSEEADVWADEIDPDLDGTRFRLHSNGQSHAVTLPLLGRHSVYTALAAVSIAKVYGVPLDTSIERLGSLSPLRGRLNPLEGVEGSLLLDDSYSANPGSVSAALDFVAGLDGRRKVAVLGEMAELGQFEEEGHREVGRKAATAVDYLVTKGERAAISAQEALRAGMPQDRVAITYTPEEAERSVRSIVRPGDIVLVKGSMVARMELVARRLLVDPDQAVDVLERQSPAWRQVQIIAAHRPTWVEIDLSAVAHNVRRIVEEVGTEVQVLAALKADAYGHGAVQVARTALANGVSMLGVACLPEAQELRRAGIDAPILVLGYTPPWQARDALLIDLRTTIFSTDAAEALSRAAEGLDRDAIVHVKVDTGMGRLGLRPEEVVAFLRKVSALPRLQIEGLFTHFAVADTQDAWGQAGWAREYTEGQIVTFTEVLEEARDAGFEIPLGHAANSAALFAFPHSRFNMVRPGIALYGLDPSPDAPCPPDFRPALVFKTQVAQVKELAEGAHISYGAEFRTERPSRIAVIPVGYGDGFRRSPRNWGEVLVRGQRAPVAGRVTMDQSMLDVTDIPGVRPGDEVILIGEQGEDRITAEDVAERLGTINYEVVSAILARVPRLH